MLIFDKHCSDVCCDEFLVPQIDRKSKHVGLKEQWHEKFYLQMGVEKKLAILNTENIKIREWITKLEAIKCNLFALFHIYWISAEKNLNF